MPYDSPQVYAKYLGSSHSEGRCEDCQDSSSTDCGCCPPGLVFINDKGCLTPNDAAQYLADKPCDAGYVKLYRNSTTPPELIGCVSEAEYATLYPLVNPA